MVLNLFIAIIVSATQSLHADQEEAIAGVQGSGVDDLIGALDVPEGRGVIRAGRAARREAGRHAS